MQSIGDDASESTARDLIGKWACVNMLTSTEREALSFVRNVTHYDARLETAIGKYMRINTSCDPCLVTAIIDYCLHWAVRNGNVLAAIAEFFVKQNKRIPLSSVGKFVLPLGLFQHSPSEEFWRVLDNRLEANLLEMTPCDVLDVLLSFIYLGKFPLKHMSKLLDPGFLDVCLNNDSADRDKLRLLDVAMTIECVGYRGPMFVALSDTARRGCPLNYLTDTVSKQRAVKLVLERMRTLTGDKNILMDNVLLECFVNLNFYAIDIFIHDGSVDPMNFTTFGSMNRVRNNSITAVLIHPQQHYCMNSRHLLGPQVMKKRQLRKLGFRVITLDLELIEKLHSASASHKLANYVKQRLKNAEEPFVN